MRLPRNGENRSGGEHPRGHDRPRTNGTNGARPAGLRTRPISLPEPDLDDKWPDDKWPDDEEPIDLVALQADDELINALAAGLTVAAADGHRDDHVTAILAAWKAEVDAEPMPALVDLDTAVTTVQAARRPSGRARHLVPVAAAAAGLVILFGGVSLGSYSAEPDDALWPVSKVLYSERAESVEAAGRVEERIARAERAIAEGQLAVAEQELRAAASELVVVRPEDGLTKLIEVQSFLQAKAEESSARTATETSPSGPSDEPGSSSATSPESETPPSVPGQVDPRIVGELPPAPAEQPQVSTTPPVDAPPPAQGPVDGENPGGSAPVDPGLPPEPAPAPAPGVDGAAPAPALEGVQSIGATAADTSTTTPSPTS